MNEAKDSSTTDDSPVDSPAPEPGADPTGTESSDERESSPVGRQHESTRRSRGGLALLALLIALAALAATGWQWWQSRQAGEGSSLSSIENQLADHADRLDADQAELQALADRLGAWQERLDDLERQADSGRSYSEETRSRLQSLEREGGRLTGRMDDLESSIATRLSELRSELESGTDREAPALESQFEAQRVSLTLIEVAGLLRLGQSRAELAADFDGARNAYRRAAARLATLEDDRLQRLQSLVADELELLEAVETHDWAALAGRLDALTGEIARWPLAGQESSLAPPGAPPEDEEEGGWWQGVRSAFGRIVRVSPRETVALAPAAAESVRERMRLHLAAAQAAAARRSELELAHHLEAAGRLLADWFDVEAPGVARAREFIDRVATLPASESPQLGAALSELERRLDAS